jgi:hypothetical protein
MIHALPQMRGAKPLDCSKNGRRVTSAMHARTATRVYGPMVMTNMSAVRALLFYNLPRIFGYPPTPLWNVLLIIFLISVEVISWRSLTDRAFKSEIDDERLTHQWWPPNMSNCLIVLSVAYYADDCLRHPPVGYSKASVSLCNLALGLGFALRHLYTEPLLPTPRKRKRK